VRRVVIAASIFALVLFILGADKFLTYRSGSDVGLFVQTIASVTDGFRNTTEGGNHFTVHFSPILAVCAPFVLATHSALALVAIAAVATASTAPPLYAIARRHGAGDGVAFFVALAGLSYPPLVGVAFADFHENVFAPAALIWLIWAFDAGRYRWAAAFALTALAVKEDEAIVVAWAALGAAWSCVRRRDRPGFAWSATAIFASITVFVSYFTIVRPLAGAHAAWSPEHFYDWRRALPANQTAPAWSPGRLTYVLEAFAPLLFVSLASPFVLLALPGFVEVLASRESVTYTMGQHYAAVWVGPVLASYAIATARIARRHPSRGLRLSRLAVAACAAVLVVASPTHWAHYLGPRTAHDAALDRVLASLPPDAPVATAEETFAHLGFDRRAVLGVRGDCDYVVLDTHATRSALVERDAPLMRVALAAGRYRQERDDDGVAVYRLSTPLHKTTTSCTQRPVTY